MDFSFSTEEQAFRQEVRTWITDNVPGRWGSDVWPIPEGDDAALQQVRDWNHKLYEAGWSGINWPTQYGGRDATPIEQFIFQEEMATVHTPPPIGVIGIGMAGPTIMAWGTQEQKDSHLKNILATDEIWCQGFSEPNAGSDLASLKTGAADAGDHYVINGQKIWTSGAHVADWCILVVRTDPNEAKHKGMTYLLVDMKSPGVEVKPLEQITGDPEFNEVFFTDVKVPKANRLGAEGAGWGVAITTLMHERVNIAALLYGRIKQTLNEIVDLTREVKRNGRPLCEDGVIRDRLAYFHNAVEMQRLNNLRMRAEMKATQDPGPIGSIFKLTWARDNMNLLEMPLQILGPYAELLPESDAHTKQVDIWMRHFLRSRANSIEGGTTEILRGIIAQRVLGLPRK